MIFGIKEKPIQCILTHTMYFFGYCYKYTPASFVVQGHIGSICAHSYTDNNAKPLFDYGNIDIHKLLSLLTLVLLLGQHSKKCFPTVKMQSAKQPLWDSVSFDLNRHQSRAALFSGVRMFRCACLCLCAHVKERMLQTAFMNQLCCSL